MTDPFPPLQPTTERPIAYQPISGWAITGLVLGSAFTLLVALSAVVALFQGLPFFYPVWIIFVPILGIAFSLYGQRQVQTSEGTRVGLKQAQWGFRLSLVSGLVYFSYYFVTEFALQRQANAFVMEKGEDSGFLPRLKEGAEDRVQLNAAFLLTQPPSARSGRPENEMSMRKHHDNVSKDGISGFLTQFREAEFLPRLLFKKLGKEAEITHLGMQDWRSEKRSYMVYHAYHIKTKEVEVQYVLAVFSAEAEAAGQGRKWFVNLKESQPIRTTLRLSETGEGILRLRRRAILALGQMAEEWNAGVAFERIKDKGFDQTEWELLDPQDGQHEKRKQFIHDSFASTTKDRLPQFAVVTQPDHLGKWEHNSDGKIRIHLAFRFSALSEPGKPPAFHVEGVAALDSKQTFDPAKVEDDTPVNWDLVNLTFTAVTAPSEKKGLGMTSKQLTK